MGLFGTGDQPTPIALPAVALTSGRHGGSGPHPQRRRPIDRSLAGRPRGHRALSTAFDRLRHRSTIESADVAP